MQRLKAAVEVEVVLFHQRGAELRYRFARRALTDGDSPDDLALRIASIAGPGACHSTSWRFDTGSVVLTYAVVPDPHPTLPTIALRAPAVVCSGDALRPAPTPSRPPRRGSCRPSSRLPRRNRPGD